MPLSFPEIAQFAFKVGQTPSPACLVWIDLNSLATGGSRGTRADQGVCPTISVQFPALGEPSDIAQECVRHSSRIKAHAFLHQLDGGLGYGRYAFGTFFEDAGQVAGVGHD